MIALFTTKVRIYVLMTQTISAISLTDCFTLLIDMFYNENRALYIFFLKILEQYGIGIDILQWPDSPGLVTLQML